mgnify:CR=1 FL=1
MSLRLRLLLAVTLMILAHAGLQVALLKADAPRRVQAAQQEQGGWVSHGLANVLANSLVSGDLATVQNTIELSFSEQRFLRLAVVDESRRTIIDQRSRLGLEGMAPDWFIALLDHQSTETRYPLTIGGVSYGEVIAEVAPGPIVAETWLEVKRALIITGAEIVLLWIMLYVLLEVGLRPLKYLSEGVTRISTGDLTVQLAATGSQEFRPLIDVINRMTGEIGMLLERTREQAASEIQARRLRAMHDITSGSGSTDDMIQRLLETAQYQLQTTQAMLLKLNMEPPPGATLSAEINVGNVPYGRLVLVDEHHPQREFHSSDAEYVKLLAQWIGLALERDRDQQVLWEEKERAQVTLASIGDAVVTTDIHCRITYMNGLAETLLGWQLADAHQLPLEKIFRIINESTRAPVANPVTSCLAENRTVELAGNTVLVRHDGTEFAIEDSAAPIRDRDGQVLGAVLVFRDATQTRALTHQLEHHANHDALTGLPNRRQFEATLERVLANARHGGKTHALCYIDLDQFKLVNDTCGHIAGDELLRQVTTLLGQRLRGTDMLARLGGDEFGLILAQVTPEQAVAAADDMCALVRDFKFLWNGRRLEIGASIGLVMITPQTDSMDVLMRHADIACYAAKHAGRNRVHQYQSGDDADNGLIHEMDWIQKLHEAIRDDRLVLWYQPIVAVDGKRQGQHVEILLRLQDDNGALIGPATFIPAAERYGIMPKIDRWVIAAVLEHARQCRLQGAEFHCAINLSGLSVGDSDMLKYIHEQFATSGVPPHWVCFEITETAAINNLARATVFINELHRLGCRFALDDFGSGVSSFGYLKNLPVDFIKIDGSFVQKMAENPLDNALVQAINHVAHVLGKQTAAEYVENANILSLLRKLGVDFAQGYGIARPAPLLRGQTSSCENSFVKLSGGTG